MIENWRDIPGHEGKYQVSDLGRVRSLDRLVRCVSKAGKEFQRPVKGVMLRVAACRGYLVVNLWPEGTIAVQILVATAFLPRPSPLHEVNHKNGDKHRNRLSNLEWLTKSENMIHAVAIGLNVQAIPVTDGRQSWPSCAQAAFEISGDRSKGGSIGRVLRGLQYTALGRSWAPA